MKSVLNIVVDMDRAIRNKEIIELRKQGVSLKEIGGRFSITGQSVWKLLLKCRRDEEKLGIKIKENYWGSFCFICKKQFENSVYSIKKHCSEECHKKGRSWYSKSCASCGSKENLHVHTRYSKDKHSYMCSECNARRLREWRKTESGKKKTLGAIYRFRKKYPEKHKAQWTVRNNVLSGNLVKPKECSRCNLKKEIYAHHEDYSKPLDIVWLCRDCHLQEHKKCV